MCGLPYAREIVSPKTVEGRRHTREHRVTADRSAIAVAMMAPMPGSSAGEHETTNLGVGGSNPSGRASQVADLAKT